MLIYKASAAVENGLMVLTVERKGSINGEKNEAQEWSLSTPPLFHFLKG